MLVIKLVRTYRGLLHSRPFVTNVATTCTFMTFGDLTSQYFLQSKTNKNESHEVARIDLNQTKRFALAGLIYVGPAVRGCLVLIDRLFGPTTSLKVLGKKILLDQCCFAPVFLVGNLTVLTLLRTSSFEEVKHELQRSYFKILRDQYCFWPFVQMVNFYFIPLTYRVLFGSMAALAWNTMFSFRLNNKTQ